MTEASADKEAAAEAGTVSLGAPWAWLAAGWEDIRRSRGSSLLWGGLFAGAGLIILLILHRYRLYNLALPLVAGFMLVAPLLAVGLYHVSRELEHNRPVGMGTAFGGWGRNPGQVALLGFILGLFFLFWIRVATLLFALFFGAEPPLAFGEAAPSLLGFVESVILTTRNLGFLIVGCMIGAAMAVVVFTISAVSAPMLIDRDVTVIEAIVVSFNTVRRNKTAMMLWAVLIVLFTGAGFLAGFIGLAVTLPLVAHATWHAYRDLVPPPAGSAAG
ncbi:MAG: DUF2189 domain-containing protein [Rhodospirillaceae bacterium]|nr:DUF2189 domain-containing protein [Rhodospirillaceae bacterium]